MPRITNRFVPYAIGILLYGFLILLNHLGILTPQESALVILLGLLSWFAGHQGTHCTYVAMGPAYIAMSRADLAISLNLFLLIIMRIETLSATVFLIWFAYTVGIYNALKLGFLSYIIFWRWLKMIEHSSGLNQRPWLVSISGIAVVPVLLIALIWLVRFPISN